MSACLLCRHAEWCVNSRSTTKDTFCWWA